MMRPALVLSLACCLLAGCETRMQDMYDQARYKALAASRLFDDGGASRPPVPDTQVHARGDFAGSSSGRAGVVDAETRDRDLHARTSPYPLTLQRLHHGQQRFAIYCAPCHGPTGDGDGLIVRRGFPAPPSYHIDRLRSADDRHLFDVISNGYGIMYPFADRLSPEERWAVVAYIRTLQLSQNAPASKLSAADRARLARSR
ncbi:MAG TPA: cytochrome c [Steroidobacteraceae bacterium]|jgi:mono/diheme cytochrome c family protein